MIYQLRYSTLFNNHTFIIRSFLYFHLDVSKKLSSYCRSVSCGKGLKEDFFKKQNVELIVEKEQKSQKERSLFFSQCFFKSPLLHIFMLTN